MARKPTWTYEEETVKKIVLAVVIALLVPVTQAMASEVEFSGSLGAYSSYIWRGYKLSGDALQLQPSATASVSGFSANIWADYDSDTENVLEVDYTASYAFKLDTTSLEVGYIHYDVRNGTDSDELYLGATFDGFLNPSLTAYVDVNNGDGAFFVAGISHPLASGSQGSLELGGSISFIAGDDYVATKPDGESLSGLFNSEVSVRGSVPLSDHVALEPMVGYTFALTDDASDAIKAGSTKPDDAFLYGAVSLTISF
jgi:hypothetical protein